MSLHPYASDCAERQYVRAVLALIGLAVAWLANLAFVRLSIPGWFWSPPSMLGAYGLAHLWFDRRGWRARWVRRIAFIRTPDLNGLWEGHVTSSIDGHDKQTSVQVRIQQRWTRMLVTLEADTSRSQSLSAALLVASQYGTRLSYEYSNTPKAGAASTMHMHPGTTVLTLISADEMNGEYYTGRDRQTYGSITLTRQVPA